MNTKKLNIKSLAASSNKAFAQVRRFSIPLFLGLVVCLYGFLVLRINSLNNTQPTPDSVTSQINASPVPHIDQETVKQLESLQNNSVNVQTLFNEARSNPF